MQSFWAIFELKESVLLMNVYILNRLQEQEVSKSAVDILLFENGHAQQVSLHSSAVRALVL